MARDTFHDLVRTGLEAEGWNVTHDPYRFLDLAITKYQLSLLVYNSQTGGLSQWIN
jgi:hypothetical protein